MPAPLLRRLCSGLYDALLLIGLLMLAGFVLVPIGQHLLQGEPLRQFTKGWGLLVVCGYLAWCWSHGGQTLPMKTWRLRVIRSDGGPLDLSRALLRALLLLAGFGLAGAPLLWAMFDRDRQCLHDRICDTRVILLPAKP